MAGTLLLISKDKKNTKQFLSKIEQLKNYTKNIFDEYFNYIIFHNLNQTSFLIEFRQDNREKFYKDVKGNWLTFEGTVFALHKTICYEAKDLWNLYQNSGSVEDFANELDGHFVIKIYDAKQDKYLVINDIIKNKTNYLVENEQFIMFTPFLLTTGILKKPQLDKYAFNEFMWRYYILSERSMLKDVKRFSPASIYTIKNGKLYKKSYWEWPHKFTKLSFNEAVDKMVSSMQESARLINDSYGKTCIDFTMGQDTRQVISAFTNQKLPFATSTFGKPDFYEVIKVKEMAQLHNIEHYNIQLKKDFYDNIWEVFKKAIILGSCEQPGYLLGRILYMRNQYKKYGKSSVNGMDGHFYKNGLWDEMYSFNLYREPRKFNINLFLKLRLFSKNYPDSIFDSGFLQIKQNSKEYFIDIIENSIKDYLKSPVSIQVDSFDLYHWLNFGIAGNSATNLIIPSLSPLLFRRNLEFAIKIPVQWKFNLSRFQRAVVYKLNKELAKEKTDFGGVNMVPKNTFTYIPFYIRYFWFQSKRLRNKILTKIGFNPTTHLQEAWDYLPLYQQLYFDKNLQKNLIYENMYLSEIIKKDEWNNFLGKFQDKNFQTLNNFEYLFKIASVEYFLQKANDLGNNS